MDIFWKKVRANAKEAGIKMQRGRIGEWNEYVEFDGNMVSRVKYVAQKSGNTWFVYKVHPGRKGAVRTLAHFTPFEMQFYARLITAK